MTSGIFLAKHPLFSFVILPILFLTVLTIASGAVEIFADHVVFGRAPNGMPLLYETQWARTFVIGWNIGVVYIMPILIALWVWDLGTAHNVRVSWLLSGGVLISILGGLHYIETRWTGTKGTSTLLIGPVSDAWIALPRIAANLIIFAVGALLIGKRRRAKS
jgi:hypothetical protein